MLKALITHLRGRTETARPQPKEEIAPQRNSAAVETPVSILAMPGG